jgi:hypothetical protein
LNIVLLGIAGFISMIFYYTLMIPFYFIKIVAHIITESIKFNKIKDIENELKNNNNIEYIHNSRDDY